MKGMELFTPFFTIENSVQSMFENREIGREVWHCLTGRATRTMELGRALVLLILDTMQGRERYRYPQNLWSK